MKIHMALCICCKFKRTQTIAMGLILDKPVLNGRRLLPLEQNPSGSTIN